MKDSFLAHRNSVVTVVSFFNLKGKFIGSLHQHVDHVITVLSLLLERAVGWLPTDIDHNYSELLWHLKLHSHV